MAKKIEILENTLLKLLVRRGTDTDRRNITLTEGELGYTTDTERLFIGNGEPGGVVAGNKFLGCDSDPYTTYSTALTGDLAFDTNTKSLCAFKGGGVWERVSTITDNTGDIDVSVDAGDVLVNALGRNLSIDANGRVQTDTEVLFNKIDTAGWTYLNIPRDIRFYDDVSSQAFTFPTNALGGKYLRTDASGNLTWEDPVGAAEFFYNSENGPIPVGAVLPFTAGGVIPTGYIVCNGQEVSQTTYSDLFNVIGLNYGSTNPGSTFKVPDYSLSTLYGVDTDPHNAQVYKVGADVNIGSELKITSGGAQASGPGNTFTVQPPAGYTMSDLQAFIPSIHEMYYSGIVSDDDTTSCKYQIGANEITVIVQNSEQRQSSYGNWLAAWEKPGGTTSGTTITQEGFGSYSTGWVNSGDNSVAVANSADLLFNHNLGSSELVFSYYVADDANGTNAQQLNDQEVWEGVGYMGALIDNINSTSFELKLGNPGYYTPEVESLNSGGVTSFAGKYIKVVALAADAVVSTPSTQSPLSAQGTIYVIKAIPDIVANPTITVVSPLTATVDGVNKTNTAFSPLVGDIVIGQPDAAEAVPPGVEAFDTAGADTFTTKTQYTKFHVTGSGSGSIWHTGASAGTCIGYLNLPIGTVLDLVVGAGVGSNVTTGNYTQIVHNGTVLVKSDGANHPTNTKNVYDWTSPPNEGTLNKTYTVGGNQVVLGNSFIIPGTSQGVDGNGADEESVGSASFWGSWPAPGSGMHANGGGSKPATTADGMVLFEWVDTVSGGTTEVTGGGSSLLKYGTIDVGNPGPITGGSIPTTGDFTTIDLGNDGANFYDIFECTFNSSLPNSNYNVVFELISNGSVNTDNNMRYPIITEKTAAGFTFSIEEGTTATQDLEINVRIVSNEVGAGISADKEYVRITGTSGATAITQTTDGTYTYQVNDLQGTGVNTSKIRGLYIRCKGRASDGNAILTATLPDDINLLRPFFQTSELNNIVGNDFIELIKFLPINKNQTSFKLEINTVTVGGIEYEIIGAEQITSAVGGGGLKDPNHATGDTINVTTSWTDLDLSSIVGSNKAQVTMEVYGGSTGVGTLFRTKGSVIEPFASGTSAGWGSSGVTPGPANTGGVVTLTTDSNGIVQHNGAGTSTGVNYKVLTYQVIS